MAVADDEYEEYETTYSSWQELRDDVDANGGVLRVSMWSLREITGLTRLKVHVVARISEALTDVGLAHLPIDLPRNQNEYVVVYRATSEAAAIINAVRNGSSSEAAERALRKVNTSDTIQVDRKNETKLDELAAKVDELENLLKDFRDVLAA
ncbi:hypothetical protein [Micromonospora sp. RL09-050-HVF-A]|uniref:hypothetical protein n=1 Tax=Micromonospora sp. RL09-050-HVF-A TaxID=1703433 RepID=UPI001C5CD85D|nr:hypothetical protein [Micromonospora sp. RL09-050-HVF-A]MBW4705195.1 hypothetical protein [Micromonospora sp. RL09-050-HVF-A]